MARLSPAERLAWQEALSGNTAPWIAFGLDASVALGSERVTGMAALIDWRVHGQVSLRIKDSLEPNSFCLFPLASGTQTFLLYHYATTPDAKAFAAQLAKLKITAVTLAESTFPKDFLPKLKQALEKQSVQTTKLEPGDTNQ